jgi:hypothetical protein
VRSLARPADVQWRPIRSAHPRGVSGVGSYQTFVDNNWLRDQVHFNQAGNDHMTDILAGAFATDGANLVPEPGTGAILLSATVLGSLLRRRRHPRR